MSQPKRNDIIPSFAYVALGSNVTSAYGSPYATLINAMKSISCESINVTAKSGLFSTPAFPSNSGNNFVNAVIQVKTSLLPQELMDYLLSLEHKYGRVRKRRWGPRTLDLDLIAYEDLILPDINTFKKWNKLSLNEQQLKVPNELILPHPRLQERLFVLMPMADIVPKWRHPVLNLTLSEMLAAYSDDERAAVKPL